MHHGGLGHLDNGKLYLPSDLLKPLSISRESVLFGLYYPPPANVVGYEHVKLKHDFMLTPVPPRLWPKIGRLVIRLKHQPNMTHAISKFLADREVTILLTESSRSGHRYATWNLTVSFDYLKEEELNFDSKGSIYKETYAELLKLQEQILDHCSDYLFSDSNDYHMKNSVTIVPDTTLSYFNQFVNPSNSQEWYYQVFKLACNDEGVIESTQGELFDAILEHISTPENMTLPKCVFANMNTNDMNIRVVVIPPEEQKRFSLVTFDYKRSGYPDSSRGIIAHITKYIPNHYNIWNLTTQTRVSMKERERGSTTLLLENQSNEDLNIGATQSIMERIVAEPLPSHLEQISSLAASVVPISVHIPRRVFESQRSKERKYKYDVFLSYSSLDHEEANRIKEKLERERLKCYMASVQVKTGDNFSDHIAEAFINSMEVCLLFTPNSVKSDWVKLEIGASWVLKKRIVSVLFQMKNEDLPDNLKSFQAINYYQLNRYVEEVKLRKIDSI